MNYHPYAIESLKKFDKKTPKEYYNENNSKNIPATKQETAKPQEAWRVEWDNTMFNHPYTLAVTGAPVSSKAELPLQAIKENFPEVTYEEIEKWYIMIYHVKRIDNDRFDFLQDKIPQVVAEWNKLDGLERYFKIRNLIGNAIESKYEYESKNIPPLTSAEIEDSVRFYMAWRLDKNGKEIDRQYVLNKIDAYEPNKWREFLAEEKAKPRQIYVSGSDAYIASVNNLIASGKYNPYGY